MATGRVPTTANSPLTAKGDLFTYSTAPARLAVGLDGEQIVADSSTSTGLRWQGDYAAGKNKIINGDFTINQRNFTTTTSGTYTFDRWAGSSDGGTTTWSAQTFTLGAAPVAGYEGNNYERVVTSGQSTQNHYAALLQKVEDVRTLANNTVTLSFWAKASSGTPYLWAEYQQNFGSGGSPSATVIGQIGSTITLSTSWTRYTVSIALPSLSGKTIGTTANTSFLSINLWTSLGSNIRGYANATFQNTTIDIWGVQLEAGSVATAFNTATGSIQGELAACQRYYYRQGGDDAYQIYGVGIFDATTSAKILINFPVSMRVAPTAVDFSTIQMSDLYSGSSNATGLTIDKAAKTATSINLTGGTGMTQGRTAFARSNNSTSAFIGFTAEL